MKKQTKNTLIIGGIILGILLFGSFLKLNSIVIVPGNTNDASGSLVSTDTDGTTYTASFSYPGAGQYQLTLNEPQEFDSIVTFDSCNQNGKCWILPRDDTLQKDIFFPATIELGYPIIQQVSPNDIGGAHIEYVYSVESACKIRTAFNIGHYQDNTPISYAMPTCRFKGTITCKPNNSSFTSGGGCGISGIPSGTATFKIYNDGYSPPPVDDKKFYMVYNNECIEVLALQQNDKLYSSLEECENNIKKFPKESIFAVLFIIIVIIVAIIYIRRSKR